MKIRATLLLAALSGGTLVLALDVRPAGAVVGTVEQVTDSGAPAENYGLDLSGDGTRLVWISNGEFGDNGVG